jgi:pimeloyl-ACP methyl ester carboxylesterase
VRVAAPELLKQVQLEDGRTLSYARLGDPGGWPALYFHGFPGSRLEPLPVHDDAARGGAQLIAIDRPGFGYSSPKPGRRILDWPDDVVAFADGLGLGRFAVIGVSGGGPYAAACALRIPERLTSAAIVCGVGPFQVPEATRGMMRSNRILFGSARYAPSLVRLLFAWTARGLRKDPERFIEKMVRHLPEPDRMALERLEVREAFLASPEQAFRQGTRSSVEEARLYAGPWGFRLEDIRMPVSLFQGERDVNVPPSMGRYQAGAIPECRAHFFPDEGHISLPLNRLGDIIATLQ